MAQIAPGERKHGIGNSITHELGSDAAVAGDAVALSSADGRIVRTTGSNGFVGVLGEQTEAGDPDAAAGVATGSDVRLELQGIVRAKVSAAVGGAVSAGEQLVPAADGALANVDDAGSAVQAGPGELQALSDESGGFALVRLP